MGSKRFFFVFGMPRCRTAWLSVLLTGRDSFCFHEGTGLRATFAEYAEMLRARPESCVGDSSPALAEHMESLIAEFPEARFLIVRRPERDSLRSFCAADSANAEALRVGWAGYMEAWSAAAILPPTRMEVTLAELSSPETCARLHEWLTGAPMDEARWGQLHNLRITSTFPLVQHWAEPAPLAVSVNVEGFDFDGLSVRSYTPDDRVMVADWCLDHRESPMGEIRLSPLGIIVEDEQGPVAALWCYETFGAGVAWIGVPVTRPGLSYARASTVLAFAIMAITQLAGKGHVPEATYTCFRVIGSPAMGRLLKRLGFVEQPDRANFYLSL